MKKVKILVCVVMVLMLSMSMMACSKKDDNSSGSSTQEEQGEAEDVGGMADREEDDSANQEQSISGTVIDATMNTVTIKTASGDEITFPTEDANMSNAQDIMIDDELTVYYSGTINGTDISNATIIAMQK